MKKCGKFNGFTIWVPDLEDIVMSKETFGSIKYRLERTFTMVPMVQPNSGQGEIQKPTANKARQVPQGSTQICPNCNNGWNVDHSGLFGGSRKCITCGGTGKLLPC